MTPEPVLAEPSDETLVARCRARDQEAFARLVDRYQYRVHALVRQMIGSADDEDLSQEVFLRAYQALPRFRNDCKFSTWLYKIARNLCLSELARRGRQGDHLPLEEEGEQNIGALWPASRDGLEQLLQQRDLARSVHELMARLPGPYRTVLTLYHLNEARYEEIAQIMDLPLGTVKTYLHRARLRLRELVLAELGG